MNIAKLTEEYIVKHPSIKDCIQKNIINYSALAREICEFYEINKFDAVLIACRRYNWKTKKNEVHENKIISLMSSVKLRIRNKMIVVIIEKPRTLEKVYSLQNKIKKQKGDFNLIEGEQVITIITNSNYEKVINELFKIRLIKISNNLVQITMLFNPDIEITSGVVTHVYGLLASKGINILEEMSCWTDLMIIIEEKDLAKAMTILSV